MPDFTFFHPKKEKALAKSRLDAEESEAVVVSLILPGVKPTLLGHALRDACPEASFHWTNESLTEDEKNASADALDQTIAFWAIIHQSGDHIIHGKEVMSFWSIFASSPWITILGNPLWRAMDSYRNILQETGHPLHRELTDSKLSVGSFYGSSLSQSICNRQSSKLVGAANNQKVPPEVLFHTAWQRLQHFAWVGLEGIDLGPQPQLARVLQGEGLTISIPVLKKQKAPRMEVSREDEAAIRAANSADFKLWDMSRRKRFWSFLRKGGRR